MTDFTELDLSKPVQEMEADEARETLSDFMDAHRANQDAYDTLRGDLEEVEAEYKEQIEDYEETIADFREQKAQEAAEYVKMPADLLADRFDYSELEEIIEEGQEFSESPDEEEEEDETQLTSFSNKQEKGRAENERETAQWRDEAKSALANQGFPVDGGK